VQLTKEKAIREHEIQIFTPAETLKLLRAAMELPHLHLLPRLVFQFFSGMRVDEIEMDDWKVVEVGEQRINLGLKDVSKNGEQRPIPFNAAFSAFLALIPESERVGPLVDRKGLRGRIDKLHAHAGVPKKDNAARHTYASHDYRLTGDDALTRKKLGHKDAESLFAHYVHDVPMSQAVEYFELRPPTDVVPLAKPPITRLRLNPHPKKVSRLAAIDAVKNGTASRLTLPGLFTPKRIFVTSLAALWHRGAIATEPKAIVAGTERLGGGIYPTTAGAVILRRFSPVLFTGFEVDPATGVNVATAEKALVDFCYLELVDAARCEELPNLTPPHSFNWAAAHDFADLVAHKLFRGAVHNRLDGLEAA
jgi:hypothetical protein